MERLTEKIGNTNCVKGCGSNCKYGFQHCRTEDWKNCKTIDDVIDKLAEYEGLEEQGRLIKLPCKVGDTLYRLVPNLYREYVEIIKDDITHKEWFIKDNIVRKGWVQELVYSPCRKLLLDIRYDDSSLDSYRGYLGNDVFLTQAEAEQKLKEMESD